ncbi:glypican-5b [Pygocentrus nattereri]|uniref:Glypican-5-like n=1 Tax=Pygocentrus nattereri TaxID=42514 RepID=A0A3B4EC85_PYGNA|nr:glypican-5b [Pygocentrus nattereri]
MFREALARVWICWLLVTTLGWTWTGHAHSCHEVKTAFQLRQVGPLRWVPETAAPDAELQICKHQGPTCCTRKMEESYHAAALRDTLQNILSYSFELKYLILGHTSAFHDTFQSLLSFTLNHTLSLFDLAYEPIARESRPLVAALFSDLSLYLHGDADISVERSVHRFYDDLFPLVYRYLVNPGLRSSSSSWSAEGTECLRATRPDVNPFGPQPQALAQGLGRALAGGRALTRALVAGAEVLNATESAGMAKECGRALVRMQYCPHCRGLTLIRPCGGLCLNVMRGCLAGLAELQAPWSRYVGLLERLSGVLAGGHELELALLGIRERINDAILNAQLHGPHLSAVVDKVCGSLTQSASSTLGSVTADSLATSVQPITELLPSTPSTSPDSHGQQHNRVTLKKRSLPLKPSKNDKPRSLKKISKEFMGYIQRYKSFFSTLPEMLCEGEMVVDDYTCWSGEDVVESYTGLVVGNGLQAQRHNPEIKVRGVDPVLVQAKGKLEQFNQEMWAEMGLGSEEHEHVEVGSGNTMETSGECDDEDGCQGSGENEDSIDRPELFFQPPTARAHPGTSVKAAACTLDSSPILHSLLLLLPLLLSRLGLDSA